VILLFQVHINLCFLIFSTKVRWTAPEVLGGLLSTSLSDVWSFGIVIWEVFSKGNTPFPQLTSFDQVKQFVMNGTFSQQKPPECIPQDLHVVASQCWKMNPSERITFEQIAMKVDELCVKGGAGGALTEEITLPLSPSAAVYQRRASYN
jgi:serine/threonine protein kinase